MRHYTVFNVQQCDGLKLPSLAPPRDFNPVEDAERVIANMPQRPPMRYDGGDRAYYVPATDAIHLPVKASFHSNDEYYATTFHELSHSTGHKSRLDRFTGSGPGYFGCADYGKEELIAEFSAAFLCAETGITNTLDNSAAYIRGWADVIKRAPELVIHAAGKGQKAADFILGSHQPRAVTAGPHDASERSLDDKIAELYQ